MKAEGSAEIAPFLFWAMREPDRDRAGIEHARQLDAAKRLGGESCSGGQGDSARARRRDKRGG